MRHPAFEQPPFAPLDAQAVRRFDPLLRAALEEDAAAADVTSSSLFGEHAHVSAHIVLRSRGVLAGLALAARSFALLDASIVFTPLAIDGAELSAGTAAAEIAGPARAILSGERTALNFLGLMSGVATLTRAFVSAVSGTGARITDTRKTAPLLRAVERYAVRAGGGFNHRFDLSAALLVKDNHITGLGVAAALQQARERSAGKIIEIECETLAQVRDAIASGADAVLLDNMQVRELEDAVRIAKGKAIIEASGGVTLHNVRAIAETGVDVISVGALTHSAPWLDVALDVER
jgi:nicotinate-nucleotide pyrophosphorylase (carboxylating)